MDGATPEDLLRWRRRLDEPAPGTCLATFLEGEALIAPRRGRELGEDAERWRAEARRLRAAFARHRLLLGADVSEDDFARLQGDAIRLLGWRPAGGDTPAVTAYLALGLDAPPPGPEVTLATPEAWRLPTHPLRVMAPALLAEVMRPRLALLRAQVGWSAAEGAHAAWVAPTLLGALWCGSWQAIASAYPVRQCARLRCRRLFVPQRATGAYCSDRCGPADDQRRRRERRKPGLPAQQPATPARRAHAPRPAAPPATSPYLPPRQRRP